MKNLIARLKKSFFSKDEISDENQEDVLRESSQKAKNIHTAAIDFYSACKNLNEEFEHRAIVENEVKGTLLLFAQKKTGLSSSFMKNLLDATGNLGADVDADGGLSVKKSSGLRVERN